MGACEKEKEPSLTFTFLRMALRNYKSNNLFWSIATNKAWQLELVCYVHCMNIKALMCFSSGRSCFEIVVKILLSPFASVWCFPCSPLLQISSVLDLRNLHACFYEMSKLTKIGCNKMALLSEKRKTFWATLLEIVSLHSHSSEQGVQFPVFGKTQSFEPVHSQMGRN